VYLFRKGINPEWEDPQNEKGCQYKQSLCDIEADLTDQLWLNLISAMLTEEFPNCQKYV
jgi:hypothetical protein